jgi:serine/threonine-protein kinase
MAEVADQGPLGLGEKFLKYSIREIVGRGGHAWVYAGRDEFFDRDVAIKILHRPGGVTPDMLRRGRAEAQLLDRLKHKNVVEVIDAGITNEAQLYIVMELLRGKTLREHLNARDRLTIGETLRLFIQTAEGVEAAHQINAVHRDLKPENLFVLEDGTPKILDFGIAKIVDSAGWSTAKDVINGTILYMSPEQLQGLRATVRSDVYALGLMLYEVLWGKHPCLLSNPSPTVRELAFIQRVKQAPLLSELDPSIPRHVARAVARAMEKLPEKRVASMSELGNALRTCLERAEREGDADAPRAARPLEERHDTEPMPRDALFDSGGRTPEIRREHTEPLNEADVQMRTISPVTTHTRSRPRLEAAGSLDARRRALRRVVGAGAVVGTLAGVMLFFALGNKAREPSAASEPAHSPPAPSSLTPAAEPVALPSAPVIARVEPKSPQTPSTPGAATAGASIPAPIVRTPKRTAAKPKADTPAAPERKVWIE